VKAGHSRSMKSWRPYQTICGLPASDEAVPLFMMMRRLTLAQRAWGSARRLTWRVSPARLAGRCGAAQIFRPRGPARVLVESRGHAADLSTTFVCQTNDQHRTTCLACLCEGRTGPTFRSERAPNTALKHMRSPRTGIARQSPTSSLLESCAKRRSAIRGTGLLYNRRSSRRRWIATTAARTTTAHRFGWRSSI